MVDLNAAYQDAKFLSDDALKQELSSPSGMIPGYIVMSELQDREALRAGSGAPKESMKDELLGGLPSVRQYSRGGIIAELNPFHTQALMMRNPELFGGYMQEAINIQAGGLPSLQAPQAPGAPQVPPALSSLQPTAPNSPEDPQKYSMGGLASIHRR